MQSSTLASKDYEGQMFIVLDRTPIENIRPDAVQYYNSDSGGPMRAISLKSLGFAVRLGHYFGYRPDIQAEVQRLNVLEIASELSSELPSADARIFAEQLCFGKMARTLLIDSRGGDLHFAKWIANGNRVHMQLGTTVTAFLRNNIKSAAMTLCTSVPHPWHTHRRAEFLWHHLRYVLPRGMPLLTCAQYYEEERQKNVEGSSAFMQYLRENVRPEKMDAAVHAFDSCKAYDEQSFRMSGMTAEEWGLAQLLDSQRRPSSVFLESTGVNIASLPDANPVRAFLESFDQEVDRETFVRSCF